MGPCHLYFVIADSAGNVVGSTDQFMVSGKIAGPLQSDPTAWMDDSTRRSEVSLARAAAARSACSCARRRVKTSRTTTVAG